MSALNFKKAPLAGWVWSEMKNIKFESVFCPFSGSANFALMFKEGGKEVTAIDMRLSAARLGKALIENGEAVIDPFDIDALVSRDVHTENKMAVIAEKYGISRDDAEWLDRVRANIERFDIPMKKDLAYCIVSKVIDFLFTMKGDAESVKPDEYIMPTFQYYIESLNEKVFSVKSHCPVYKDDANTMVFGIQSDALMIYLPDPAGYADLSAKSRFIELFNNYCGEKELDNLLRAPVQGLGGKLENAEKYTDAVKTFLDSAAHIPIWIIGTNKTRPISNDDLGRIIGRYKKKVKAETKEINYIKGLWQETLFVATD